MLKFPILADLQQIPPDAYCDRCQVELWGREADPDMFGHVLCPECQLAIRQRYNRTQAVDSGGVA